MLSQDLTPMFLILRSEQTQHQIESARVTNNFKVYTDHQAYFTDLLKSFKDDLKIEPLENRFRYSDFSPDNNIEQMRLTSTGRNNSKSIILEWNDRISQLSKLFQELLAKIDNNNEASEDYVNWLQSFQDLENAFGVCYQSESYRSYIFLVEGGVEVKVDGIPWDIDRCLDAIIDMLHLLNTKLLLDTQHSISVQQFYTSSNSNIEGILTNASTKHVIEGLGTFS